MSLAHIDIIIPVFNESMGTVIKTLDDIRRAGSLSTECCLHIFIVNDGSDPEYQLEKLRELDDITYLSHSRNRGYGQALKTGILAGSSPYIGILDADGTYPASELPKLIDLIHGSDMVLGVRTGTIREIPLLRRFPKLLLNKFASYMAGRDIVDLNTGMRIFTRDLAYHFWGLYPSGFSFTSTLTMGAAMGDFRVRETPINYYKRHGDSSIHPIKDTVRFFRLVARLGLLFSPKRLFTPIALLLITFGLIKGVAFDYANHGHIGNLALIFILSGIQIFMMGLIAQLVILNRAIALDKSYLPIVRDDNAGKQQTDKNESHNSTGSE